MLLGPRNRGYSPPTVMRMAHSSTAPVDEGEQYHIEIEELGAEGDD